MNKEDWQAILDQAEDDIETGNMPEQTVMMLSVYNSLNLTPVLHDRLFPLCWCPGINLDHEQARGLVAAFPMWD